MTPEEKEEAQRLIDLARDRQCADDICNALEYVLNLIPNGHPENPTDKDASHDFQIALNSSKRRG